MLKAKWQQLSQSEQKAMTIGAVVVFLMFIWGVVWQPLQLQKLQVQQRLLKLESDYNWMQQTAPYIKALQSATNNGTTESVSLLSLIDQSLRKSALSQVNKRINPRSETQIQVSFDQVDFNVFITWLNAFLTAETIQIHYLTLEAHKISGMVQVHLSLKQS